MTQDFTLHTHTVGFDGKNTITEMANRASELGFKTIGISNHFTVHPEIKRSKFYPIAAARGYGDIFYDNWPELINKFTEHYAKLNTLRQESNIQILRGMEIDFFESPQWRKKFESVLKTLQPDYLIGSCHIIEHNGQLFNVHDMRNTNPETREQVLTKYWAKIRAASNSGLFTWLAHLDLPKKVGLGQEETWIETEHKTIETLSKNNTPIEINTALFTPECFEPYPSPRILKIAASWDIPVLLSDDAHHISQLGRHFDTAKKIAQDCGIKNFLNLQKTLDFSNKRR